MLQQILAFSLRNRMLVVATSIAVAVLGAIQVSRTSIDVLPSLDRPVVSILTDAHGLSPESVENLVTRPIERAVSGSTGVLRVRSTSSRGLSVVQIDFDWGTDLLDARQIVSERLQLANSVLPDGVHTELAPISSIMGQIQLVGLRSRDGTTDAVELRRLVDRELLPSLLSIAGVAQVTAIGGQPSELQVTADADLLRAFDVTIEDVADAVRRANVAAAGGTLELGASGPVIAIRGLVESAEDLGAAIVREDPVRPVRLDDVADVLFGPTAVRIGSAGIDGEDGIVVVLTKQPGTDTVELTERIDARFEAFRAALPADVEIDTGLFRQAEFIDRAIENVLVAVRDGAILVVVILFLFLMNLRTTGITLLAIPMSIAIASLVFAAFGLTINTMTLGGLAVAIGTLVDDAIVDVENVYRRLRERPGLSGRALLDLVLDASKEIRRPVVYGTLLVSVTYVPLFFLSGMEGRLLAPVGLAFLVSVGASLLVAMTLTPVLCSFWLGGAFAAKGEYGSRAARMIQDHVDGIVRFGIRHATAITATVAVLTLAAAFVLANRGATFLPPFQEGSAQVNLMLPPDVSLATSEAFGRRLEVAVGAVDGVASVARRTGRAPDDEHIMPLSVSEAIVRFDPDHPRDREAILDDVRHALDREFPGVARSTEQPLAHLLSHLLSGVNAQVAIKIHGDDLTTLRAFADRIERAIAGVEGVRDLYIEPLALVDHCEVRPRRDDLAEFGVSAATLAHSLELALGGETISRLQSDKIPWPIVVRLPEAQRGDPDDIAAIRLGTPTGEAIRVADVADVTLVPGPSEVRRENGQRRIVVQHNVSGRALGDVVADVEARIAGVRADLERRPGYGLVISGTFEAQQRATRTIAWLSIGAVLAMILILHRHFGSLKLALLILATRPIAFLGAVAAVLVTGQDLSVATLVGLIALLGVAVRNAILYVDYAAAISGGARLTADVLRKAARARVVPVLMTALTSGIGVLPLALSGDEPGREILYPVATVILGGLVTNTLLDFLVTPGLLEGRTAGRAE